MDISLTFCLCPHGAMIFPGPFSQWPICPLDRCTTVHHFLNVTFFEGYKFSRASYVLSLLRPQIVRDLELKKHGLKVYLRDPGSYTPLRKDHWRHFANGEVATSLILGRDHQENVRQISQFSTKDAENLGPFEEQLERCTILSKH